MMPAERASRTTALRIIDATATYYGISANDILADRRNQGAIRPRHVAMWLACRASRQSTVVLGRVFRRDHTTIIYARDNIDRALRTDPGLRQEIGQIHATLGLTVVARGLSGFIDEFASAAAAFIDTTHAAMLEADAKQIGIAAERDGSSELTEAIGQVVIAARDVVTAAHAIRDAFGCDRTLRGARLEQDRSLAALERALGDFEMVRGEEQERTTA